MKTTTEPLENRQVALTIEVDEERIRKLKRRVARQISKEVSIPGFRKGKAPYSAIVQRFGENIVQQEIVNLVGEEVYREALEQENLNPYRAGVLEDFSFDPLTLKFTVPLVPKVELGDYRNYRREAPDVTFSEERVERSLEQIRQGNAILTPVERPAALGDAVVADIEGRTQDGELIMKEDEARFVLDTESERILEGFDEAVVGMEAGEERTFTLTLPEDFADEDLQGAEIDFVVAVSTVYDRTLPELDDDLARTVGNFETFEELEEQVRNRLRESSQAEADKEYQEQVLQDIIEQAEVEYPPVMVEEAVDNLVESYEQSVRHREHLSLDDFLRIEGKTMDDLRGDLRVEAVENLERFLVLGEVVRREGLEVSDEEIDAQIEQSSAAMGERSGEVRSALSTGEAREGLRSRMLANSAIDRLVAIAKGEAPDLSAEETEEDVEEASEPVTPSAESGEE